ncbi:scarecrow-like transcription factor PAT1 [Ipomoea triloba]|uniref:scarecrow-like transcription factor PAT1 n=1 Tax=Ipomoea triloba TaxID=35885 RepID=UPI00125E5284|nr:scarecrow-like transcription factor PAT1 [Ipomoea triloba]XP_031105600.1 scarecrow-like transcription factor PAT1 [Ipomoea triloba]XP_031105601.1 scarecrow-like transcription factor PAT1 [Ipomoea triloba]XP_031105602.1 scarecrow-like transcription factor PAT1 [Ipomoea triloba]
MRASRLRRTGMSNTLCFQQKAGAYCVPQFQILDQLSHSDNGGNYSIQAYSDHCCTRELSSKNDSHARCNSSSTISFSPYGSPMLQQEFQSYPLDLHQSPETKYSSPISMSSSITDDMTDFRHKLKELESVMLGPDSDVPECYELALPSSIAPPELDSWRQMMEAIPVGDLKQVLVTCAKAISINDLPKAECLMSQLRQMVSVSGEPIQRLGAYVLEGLVARLDASGSSIYKSLKCKEPESFELLSYMHILYEVCPYFKFGYMSANGAIAEAMKGENRVHIIDFQIGQGSQWVTLIQAFAARPGGPPHIRITGIDDSTSAYARRGGLNIVGKMLSKLAESFNVPFEFHAASMSDYEVQVADLGIHTGEALAVNFAFMLHHTPDESVSTQNHRDELLRLVKGLNPKVVTLVEQECNTNTAPFFPRFLETLDYYIAMFESIDVNLPREDKQRINVEQHCLARDVVNIIACEGTERVERHELLGKWKSRFRMAGFSPYPLSSLVNATIKTLLGNYSSKYRLEERDGALYLGWMKRDLVASCAWK